MMSETDRTEVPEGGADRVDPDGPATPRPASTVVLVRDAARGPEVLLLRRPPTGFAAGAWVFPGGAVDSDDYRLEAATSEQPAAWAARMELDDPALAWGFVVAALRETWEETGVLLGADSGVCGALGPFRAGVLTGAHGFAAVAAHAGFRPDGSALGYISRWVTPPSLPRRFDTRFFVAAVDAATTVTLEGGELLESAWLRPEDALAAHSGGEIAMMHPTVHTLRRLVGLGTAALILADASSRPPTSHHPRMRTGPEGVIIDGVQREP